MRGNGRVVSAALAAAGACSALTLAAAATATAAGPAAAAAASGAAHPAAAGQAAAAAPVIIFLRKPLADAASPVGSAGRLAQIRSAQAPYLARLARLGATGVHSYRLADAIAARVPASALAGLGTSPGVASVIPDSTVTGPGVAQPGEVTPAARKTLPQVSVMTTPPGACSASPQLEPEGLALTGTAAQTAGTATARSLGYTGAGVKVAFLADGIDQANANLMRGGTPVISDYQDFSGEGTAAATAGGAAFADASAIAGQGAAVYNVAGFSAQLPATPCEIRIQGTAPGASLVALKVFGHASTSTTSAILQAIDYAVVADHVNVLDESFGANPFPDVTSLDAVKEFNDMAVAAGTTVVVGSGDAGPLNTIGSPASDPAVISVGASTGFQFYAQTNFAGADQFAPGGWESGNVSSLSSGGFTQNGRTLDLVAPGDASFVSCTPSPLYSSCVNFLGEPSLVTESGGHQPGRAARRGRRGAGHPGIPHGAPWPAADAGNRQAHPAVHRDRPGGAGHRAGCRPARQPAGGQARRVAYRPWPGARRGRPGPVREPAELHRQAGRARVMGGESDERGADAAARGLGRARLRLRGGDQAGGRHAVRRAQRPLHELVGQRVQLRPCQVHRAAPRGAARRVDRLAGPGDAGCEPRPRRSGSSSSTPRAGSPPTRCRRAIPGTAARRCCTRRRAAGRRSSPATRPRPAVPPARSQFAATVWRTVRFGAMSPASLVPRARRLGRGARVRPGPGERGRLKRLRGARHGPRGRAAGDRARHAARPGAGRPGRDRDVQRDAGRRQRPFPRHRAGRRLLVRRAVESARSRCATSTSTWCSPTTRLTR